MLLSLDAKWQSTSFRTSNSGWSHLARPSNSISSVTAHSWSTWIRVRLSAGMTWTSLRLSTTMILSLSRSSTARRCFWRTWRTLLSGSSWMTRFTLCRTWMAYEELLLTLSLGLRTFTSSDNRRLWIWEFFYGLGDTEGHFTVILPLVKYGLFKNLIT